MRQFGSSRLRGPRAAIVRIMVIGAVVAPLAATSGSHAAQAASAPIFVARSLDGSGNNAAHSAWGMAGSNYIRIAAANYADGKAAMVSGPNARYISNRILNDTGQNLFSENNISQWGWAWGQFLDHDLGLRNENPGEDASVPFNSSDPLEAYSNETGSIAFNRTPAAPGTGTTSVRQQVNTLSNYIDASNVYGVSNARLDWLRVGTVDGNPANNGAALLMPGGYLPRATARGNAATAPAMDLQGALAGTPGKAMVAGDVRANENIALTAIQTLFAREHNRIVALLPKSLPAQTKFSIARRVVGAEVQYITYTQFLPAMGVKLPAYTGYKKNVNAAISDEFATVGYRAHSMVHGEFAVAFTAGTYSPAQLSAFHAEGIAVTNTTTAHSLTIPLSVAFGNPDLLQQVGLGAVLSALAAEHEYRNDEEIDNTMRSVLFEVPKPGTTDPTACQTPVVDPRCFTDVADLGVDDIMRGRDHGMPKYNDLRRAYGLAPIRSFTAITGETNNALPAGLTINDPHILDVIQLRSRSGQPIDLNSPNAQTSAVSATRRSSLAARLKAIYGTPDNMDAFVGMISEKHIKNTEFGELQLAIWTDQFERLRDGDRFFYAQDSALAAIKNAYGINYQTTLANLIALNTPARVAKDVFHASS
jgi:hypothetical protein